MKINFIPSASVCRMPNGPALFGPMRFCIPAMTLRSNQTMNIVATRATAKMTRIFNPTMISGVHLELADQQRVEGDHLSTSIRDSASVAPGE